MAVKAYPQSSRAFWLFVGLILVGCADRLGPLWGSAPLPFAPEFYHLPRTARLSTPLVGVAVYQFVDKRSVATPTVLGEHPVRTGTSGRAVFYATEPVGTGVARAFVESLRAQGFQVLDRTMNPLNGKREEEPSIPAISGEVLAFSSSSRRTGLVSYVGGAAFHVRVQVYGRQLAEVLWERVYSRTSDAFLINSQLVFLSRSLAESVEDAMNDPSFIEALRRSSN